MFSSKRGAAAHGIKIYDANLLSNLNFSFHTVQSSVVVISLLLGSGDFPEVRAVLVRDFPHLDDRRMADGHNAAISIFLSFFPTSEKGR